MENKKSKRGRPRAVGGQPSRKKSRSVDDSDQEMREKIEAANVLSSLKFMAPQSQEPSPSASSTQAASNAEKLPSTYKMSDTIHGISAGQIEAPPVTDSKPVVSYLSHSKGAIKTAVTSCQGVVLSEQANKFILMHLYNSLQTRQAKSDTQTSTTNNTSLTSNIPSDSIIPKSEATRKGTAFSFQQSTALPIVLQPQNPVNRAVAAALKNAISVGMAKIHNPPKQSGSHTNLSARHSATRQQIDERDTDSQETDKKTESQETNLPLKKRRILANEEDTSLATSTASSLGTSKIRYESEADVKNLLRLAQSTQMTSMISGTPTQKPYTGDGYKPIDPSASLRVLSDVKQALTPDEDGDLPLHIAVVHKNNALVKRFVEIMTMSGKSVDRYNKLMQTPLHLAVLVEEPEIIMTLLSSNANPNLVDRNGCTAMHVAVEKGFHECLETVLENSMYDCYLDTRNYEGYTPLHTTVENNDMKAMLILVKNGANIDAQDGKAGRSVIYYAVEYHRYDMCRYLYLHEASLDLANYAGITAAMAAQSTNQDGILDLIGKPTENSRPLDESLLAHSTRKLPLPRIPSKASLIGPDQKPFSLSRANSVEDVKPYPVRRPSCSSPVDLSLKDTIKTEDIKPYVKTEKPSASASTSILKSTLTAGKTKYKPAKLVEKHAVLVEQLQRQNKTPADPGPYIYLSKEKYKALLELSMQRYRAAQSVKAAAGWTKTRTLSVDETRPRDYSIMEKPLKSDLTVPSKTSQKGKADKPLLNERENEILERIKSAKSKEWKEGKALLSVILDSDLSKKLAKLEEVNEPAVSVDKQPVSSMKLRTVLSETVIGGDKPTLKPKGLTSVSETAALIGTDKPDHEEVTTDNQEKPVLSGQGSDAADQGLDETMTTDESDSKTESNYEDDSGDLKLSQGIDIQNVEETHDKKDVEKSSSKNVVKSRSEKENEDKNDIHEIKGDKDNVRANDEPDKMNVKSNRNVVETDAVLEEDSSSVEVQEVLPMDEDDTEDGALVIDEKVGENRSLKSSNMIDNLEVEMNSDMAKTNEAMTSLDNTVLASSNYTSVNAFQISSLKGHVDGLSCVTKDIYQIHTEDSESKAENIMDSSEENNCSGNIKATSTLSKETNSESNSPETNNSSDHGREKEKGLLTENKVDACKETNQGFHFKEKANNDDKSISEESMCRVHERTEWETESLATCKPPPLTKFEQASQAEEVVLFSESAENENASPPRLSKFGNSSERSSFDTDEKVKEPDSTVSGENDNKSNDCVNSEKSEFKDESKSDKKLTEDSSVMNKGSEALKNTSNRLESDLDKTEEWENIGETKLSVAQQETDKYMNDSGFQFYLKERGVKLGDGVDLEQHYLAYKNVEDRILRDVGIIPLVKRHNNEEKTSADQSESKVNEDRKMLKNKDPSFKVLGNEKVLHSSVKAMSMPGTSTENTSEQEQDPFEKDTLTLQTDFKTINVSKAHTLYFFDGQNYRAVKVYVDDTEASSEQFKKMFSESLNKGLGSASVVLSSHNGPPQVSSATVHSVPERVCEKLPVERDAKTYLGRAKDDNSVSYGPSRDKNIASLTKTSKSASFDSGRVQQSLREIHYRQGTKTDPIASGSKFIESDSRRSFVEYVDPLKRANIVHPNSSDMNLASIVDNAIPQKTLSEVQNEVQDLSKKTAKVTSNPVMSQIFNLKQPAAKPMLISRTLGMTSAKSPVMTSEGTLTRVNPDIKNRLSKALQSPARKLNITKSDSSDRLLIPITKTDSSERILIPITKIDSCERLLPVTSSSGIEVPVTKDSNLRLQM